MEFSSFPISTQMKIVGGIIIKNINFLSNSPDKRGTVRVLRVEDDGDARDGDERHHALLYLHALHQIAQPLGDGIAAVLFDLIIIRDYAVRCGHEFAIFRWRQHRYSFRCGHDV